MSQPYVDRRFTSPDGLSLYARDHAPGPGPARLPLIAIHGLTRNSADFETVAPLIAQSGRRVLAVDVRGRGRSDRAPDPMTYVPAVYARDILALMDQAGIGRAVFLGTSMGGLITMALAGIRPKAIAAAIVNDVGPELGEVALQAIADYVRAPQPTFSTWAEAEAWVTTFQTPNFPHYQEADWRAFARRLLRETPDGTLVPDYDPEIAAPLRGVGTKALVPPLWPQFRRLTKQGPTLLIRGGNSGLLGPEQVAKMRRRAPELRFAEVPGVGHAPMLDEPEARAAIFEFLAEAP